MECHGNHDQVSSPAGRLSLCAGGIRTFISALEKVADLNGIRRDKPSWRHASIARRVEFLQQLLERPGDEPRIQRRMLLTKFALFAVLGLSVAGLWHYVAMSPPPTAEPTPAAAHAPLSRDAHSRSL
jgi:STE24 endopeptidase